jgi:hypothetical protein
MMNNEYEFSAFTCIDILLQDIGMQLNFKTKQPYIQIYDLKIYGYQDILGHSDASTTKEMNFPVNMSKTCVNVRAFVMSRLPFKIH